MNPPHVPYIEPVRRAHRDVAGNARRVQVSPIANTHVRRIERPAPVRPTETSQMPIYEYQCKSCEHQFETLVRGKMTPKCPKCESEDLDKLLSLPRVHSEGRKARSLKAAKKRDQKQGDDRMRAQREYELSHDD